MTRSAVSALMAARLVRGEPQRQQGQPQWRLAAPAAAPAPVREGVPLGLRPARHRYQDVGPISRASRKGNGVITLPSTSVRP